MWSRRIRFLVTISCIVASPVTGQGYGALDDDGPPQQFGNQRPVGGNNQFPPNQQASNLPQYESAEQAPRQNPAFPQPPQQQFSPQGQGGPAPAQQPGGSPPWWQGQNAFQRPPGHPGVEMLAPPGQQQQAPYNAPPTQPPYGAPAPPQPPATQQPYANPQSPPPVPQEPNIPQFNNPAPQPQQPGFGWNAPQSQQPPRQNYNPQGQGFPPVDEAPGCDLVNKADCHNRNVPPPPQNYQPPPQFQQPQPYQPQPQQQQPYQPVPLPNQGYQPPPPQPTTTRAPYTPAPTPRPYQPPQAPRPNNPYQSNQASSPNFQQPPRQQQQRPYTPPQTPQAQQQQQAQEAGLPYPGCPAAMKCVQDDYCNAIGLIEDAPIQFSAADRLHRVALMQCSEPMTGIVGVCCRDPNYTDPWPDMKKDGGHHHHPVDKGQAQGQFQPPQGNHLQSGNPYSGSRVNRENGETRYTGKFVKASPAKNSSQISFVTSSSPNLLSESQQTLQVLEPCVFDELCLSMSQCHSLNPQFMLKTGLSPLVKRNIGNNFTEPVKIKRCKYERSGIHYLCCEKPGPSSPSPIPTARPTYKFHFTPTRFLSSTTPGFSTFSTTPRPTTTSTPSPTIFTLPFNVHPTPSTTPTKSTSAQLITGFGLRFHSGLHTAKQEKLNSQKPNPYGANEEPIQLISPFENTVAFTPAYHTILSSTAAQQPFRFTTTPVPNLPVTKSQYQGSSSSTFSSTPSQEPLSAFARIIGTSRTYFSTTTLPTTIVEDIAPTLTSHSYSPSSLAFSSVNISTTTLPTTQSTTTEGKVDVLKIPIPVPLRPELKLEPPIGFIFKGEDLYVPEVDIPSQNFLLPEKSFEERVLPTDPPAEEEQSTEDFGTTTSISNDDDGGEEVHERVNNERNFSTIRSHNNSSANVKSVFSRNIFLHNNSIEGTTIYSLLDESGSQERAARLG